jgi:hypothetical protein
LWLIVVSVRIPIFANRRRSMKPTRRTINSAAAAAGTMRLVKPTAPCDLLQRALAMAWGSVLRTARREIRVTPTPARTTNVAAARPSRKPNITLSYPGPLPSSAMTREKWTTTIPKMASARAISSPTTRSAGTAGVAAACGLVSAIVCTDIPSSC